MEKRSANPESKTTNDVSRKIKKSKKKETAKLAEVKDTNDDVVYVVFVIVVFGGAVARTQGIQGNDQRTGRANNHRKSENLWKRRKS